MWRQYLKHSLEYICNEAKTENRSLVGGINCLPDYAYEQMIGTEGDVWTGRWQAGDITLSYP